MITKNMKKSFKFNFTLIISLLFSGLATYSQNIDSLKYVYSKAEKMDKEKINEIIGAYYLKDFELDSSYKYFSQALELSETDFQKSNIYENIGMIYFYKNDFTKALDVFNKSLQLAIKIDKDSILARRYSDIGVVYDYLSANDKAVEYYIKSLTLFQKMNDKYGIAKTMNNLGVINENMGKLDIALKYYQTSLKYKQEIKAKDVDLASTYVNIGSVFEKNGQFAESLTNYQKAYNIFKKTKVEKYTALTLNNIANTYFYLEKFDSAKYYINKAEFLNTKISNNLGLTSNFILKAKILEHEKQIDSSIYYLQKALELSNTLKVLKKKAEALRELSKAYKLKKDYTNAYFTSEELVAINDSLYKQEISDKTQTLQTVYETEKKENEINNLHKNLKNNRLLWIFTALILILITISIFFIFRQKLIKSKYQENLFNQRLLRAQMNPHFIFNALTSIQSFMLEKDTKKAAFYLSAFSKLSRSILNNSQTEFIELQEEIDTLENYCKIQQMRFNEKFDFKIICDENIDIDNILIPPMLAQPFVENAIKHGFKNIDYKGIITIDFKLVDEKLKISISDNGIGFNINSDETKKSHAIEITKERLKILNKNKKDLFSFKIENISQNMTNKGTKIVFSLPLNK